MPTKVSPQTAPPTPIPPLPMLFSVRTIIPSSAMEERRLLFTQLPEVPAAALRLASPAASSPSRSNPGAGRFSLIYLLRALGHGFAAGARERCFCSARIFSIEQRFQVGVGVDRRGVVLHEPSSIRRRAVIAVQVAPQHPQHRHLLPRSEEHTSE